MGRTIARIRAARSDRWPKTFVNIPTARPEDFRKATQRVYHGGQTASALTVQVLPERLDAQ